MVAEDGRYYFIANRSEQLVRDWVPLGKPSQAVALMDPLSRRTGVGRLRAGADGSAEVYLALESGEVDR